MEIEVLHFTGSDKVSMPVVCDKIHMHILISGTTSKKIKRHTQKQYKLNKI